MKGKRTRSPAGDDLRRQAEAKLKKRPGAAAPPETEDETRRLLHELQVHQIELEMQNDELARAREEMTALLKQYSDLYDFAPVGYFTLARDGTIRRANVAGARLLGQNRASLVKRRFAVFISADSRPEFNGFLARVFGGRKRETCEAAIAREGMEPLWTHIEAMSFDGEQECHAAVVDISERRKAHEDLKRLSNHDALTGLYNRGYFEEQMTRLERGRQFPISLLMADVDGLKPTNDRYGHAAGDATLKRTAQVMTVAFRADDVVARLGGDEFGVLLPGTDAAAAEAAIRRVRQLLEAHNAANAGAPIRLSMGVSTAEERTPLAEVLKAADEAMYQDKRGTSTS